MASFTLALVACSTTDLSELTGRSLATDAIDASDGVDGSNDEDSDDLLDAEDGGSDDDASTEDAASDGAPSDDAATNAADGGDDAATTDAATEDATPGPGCGVTDFLSPSAAANVYQKADDGSVHAANDTWIATTNALTEDAKFATANATSSVSQLLLVSGFGFSLADAAVIKGVDVQVVRASNGSGTGFEGSIVEGIVQLRPASGTSSQASRTLSGTWTSTVTTVSYGGATDTWGETLTGAVANKTAFGVLFSFRTNKSIYGIGGRVDAIRVRLHYCE